MRTISFSLALFLASGGFCDAAVFSCEMTPGKGAPTGTCATVDTTKTSYCRQDYSSTLFAQCAGRQTGSGDQLICYFANPANPPNLIKGDVIDQAGVQAVSIQWADSPTNPSPVDMVFDYKDGQNALVITCSPDLSRANKK